MPEDKKPNCYKCKYRGECPGSAHSRCVHPKVTEMNPLQAMSDLISMMRGVVTEVKGLKVKGNPHGIRNGWFAWPFNFDPVWLEECNGFENKVKAKKEDNDTAYIPEQGD